MCGNIIKGNIKFWSQISVVAIEDIKGMQMYRQNAAG